jgi:hypothetical protein
MPSTYRKLELKAKTSMAQTASQAAVYAKGISEGFVVCNRLLGNSLYFLVQLISTYVAHQSK